MRNPIQNMRCAGAGKAMETPGVSISRNSFRRMASSKAK